MKYTIIQTETFTRKIKTEIVVDDKPPKKKSPTSQTEKPSNSNTIFIVMQK